MEGKKNINKYILPTVYIIYTVGIFGHLVESLREYMLLLTPYSLALTGGLVLYVVLKSNTKLLYWIILVYVFTFVLEVVGVKTGFIFGSYSYGEVLGIKVFDTPLIIGFNWVLVILGAIKVSEKFTARNWLIVLASSLLAVLFDFVLEPVAVTLGYWNWENGVIPIQNYIAWFVIALMASIFYKFIKVELDNSIPIHYFCIQLVFFVLLNIGL